MPAPADPPVASLGTYSPSAPGPTDDRLFQVTAGGHLLERDAATGALRADRAGVGMGAEADYTADDGRLFAVSREEPYRIQVSDLDRDGSRILYTGAA